MTRDHHGLFEYDVALSFAGEDRGVADALAKLLIGKNISVLYDEYKPDEPWGRNPVDHLVNLYARKARYCLMLISRHYPLKTWTEAERTDAQERAFRDPGEYILPIRLDETEVPGITESIGYRDLRQHSLESVVDFLEQQLHETKGESGPPPRSHDLRSGNIPSTRRRPDRQ